MSQKIVILDAFNVIGIPLRTSNEKAADEIGAHWQKFYTSDILAKIPDKKNGAVVALYTDYESDHTKPYTLILGAMINNNGSAVPETMVIKKVPTAKYAVFPVTGEMPAAIFETWGQIWNVGLERTYTGDFELYDPRPNNPEQMQIEIYIAIR